MTKITDIKAREVIDSRGNPTKPFTKSLEGKDFKDNIKLSERRMF